MCIIEYSRKNKPLIQLELNNLRKLKVCTKCLVQKGSLTRWNYYLRLHKFKLRDCSLLDQQCRPLSHLEISSIKNLDQLFKLGVPIHQKTKVEIT